MPNDVSDMGSQGLGSPNLDPRQAALFNETALL